MTNPTGELSAVWRAFQDHLIRRKWAIGVGLVYVAVGLLYSFFWGPVVDHSSIWQQPGDMWATFRVAHLVGWGDIGDIYSQGAGFITFPGIAVLLAPLAMLAWSMHWTESYPYPLAHASGWPVLAVAVMGLGIFALVALDALAEHLGASRNRRIALSVIQAAILFNVDVVWGHPEDAVAVAFGVYGLLAVMRGRIRQSGWCIGFGIAFQPFLLLALPVALARMTWHDGVRTLVRAALPAVLLLAIPVATAWRTTSQELIKQPTFPAIDHPTPLLPLAPVLRKPYVGGSLIGVRVGPGGVRRFVKIPIHSGEVVSPGFCRLIALLVAIGLGVLSRCRRSDGEEMLWFVGASFAGWCALEPVMTPYYLWPALAVIVASSIRRRAGAVLCVGLLALGAQWWAQRSLGEWAWYGPIMGAIALMLWLSRPDSMRLSRRGQVANSPCDIESEPPARSRASVTMATTPVEGGAS
jgi:hypothetical protein